MLIRQEGGAELGLDAVRILGTFIFLAVWLCTTAYLVCPHYRKIWHRRPGRRR